MAHLEPAAIEEKGSGTAPVVTTSFAVDFRSPSHLATTNAQDFFPPAAGVKISSRPPPAAKVLSARCRRRVFFQPGAGGESGTLVESRPPRRFFRPFWGGGQLYRGGGGFIPNSSDTCSCVLRTFSGLGALCFVAPPKGARPGTSAQSARVLPLVSWHLSWRVVGI